MFITYEMVDMLANHEENTMLISYEMVELGNGLTKKRHLEQMAKKFGVWKNT